MNKVTASSEGSGIMVEQPKIYCSEKTGPGLRVLQSQDLGQIRSSVPRDRSLGKAGEEQQVIEAQMVFLFSHCCDQSAGGTRAHFGSWLQSSAHPGGEGWMEPLSGGSRMQWLVQHLVMNSESSQM